MSLLDKMKSASKMLVDVGAKTMLKTDVVFLEREITSRKQQFGVEVYEMMEELEVDTSGLSVEEKEAKIRLAFDKARKDIAVILAKIECKKEEMDVIDNAIEDEKNTATVSSLSVPTSCTATSVDDRTEMEHGVPP